LSRRWRLSEPQPNLLGPQSGLHWGRHPLPAFAQPLSFFVPHFLQQLHPDALRVLLELPDLLNLGHLATVSARPGGPSTRGPRSLFPLFPRLARSLCFPKYPLPELGGEHLGSRTGFCIP